MWEVTDTVSFLGGVRWEHIDQRIDNALTAGSSQLKVDPVDFRAGVRYRPDPRFAFHVNWGQGFRANSSVGRLNNVFDPETGNGYEAGAKMVLSGMRASLTYFKVSKSNILATDPVDQNFLAAVGQIQARGIEMDGQVDLARGVRLIGNYAYTDAKAEDPQFPTGDVLNVPRHSGTLQLFATVPVSGKKLDLSAGGTYVGSRAGALDGGNLRLDAYFKAKASVSYDLSDTLSIRAEVDNLFNTTYAQNSYSALWIYPGAPRSALVSLTARL
jgi:iron complex outermembrane receptor protein